MKSIVKVIAFTLAIVLICQCENEPEPIIPDNAFLNALIELGVDSNGDGEISPGEAETVTELDVSECGII